MPHSTQRRFLNVFAPVKINLYLHITGRLGNGYHTLDSLVSFADIGDQILIEPAKKFQFKVIGPYADAFDQNALDKSAASSNLAVQAAWRMAKLADKELALKITLTKNIPLSSGIGGGSADAAAVIWGLKEWWSMPQNIADIGQSFTSLGADVPICLHCRSSRILNIGDKIMDAPYMAETPIVLVNPAKPCLTERVFQNYEGRFTSDTKLPDDLSDFHDLISLLKQQKNDLQISATEIIPEISNVLNALNGQSDCVFSQISGSGATCFGLFEYKESADVAAAEIAKDNPDWWVKSGWLNRPERY